MCGISGAIGAPAEAVEAESTLMHHRGPDASGVYRAEDGAAWLAHTRLAIVDLSEAANQPFRSADGRYVLVYNGEVYNHKELANKHALRTRTSSDTEVVVELYAKLGVSFLGELNGMFAGAIYDTVEGSLFLFRDRLGIKPLYYFLSGGGFAFCSELPPLVDLLSEPKLREQSLADFLHFGYVPEPHTLYEDVFKFPAGHFGVFAGGRLNLKAYWKAEDHILATVESEEPKVLKETEELLRDSVRMRLMADVPFGTFLSGGADSGLISALAADLSPTPIDTFNVSFEDAPFDETPYAREMARIIGSRHHPIRVTREAVLKDFAEGAKLVGEPFADSSVFPTMAVSEFAAKHVKMALSGDGGDELFMGYGTLAWADRLANPELWRFRKVIAGLLRLRGDARSRRGANVFSAPGKVGLAAHIFSQDQNLFSAAEVEKITEMPYAPPPLEMPTGRKLTPAEAQSYFDLTHYLKDDLLVKVDRSSMRYGLEVRVPFLDHRLVEYALNIDPALKRKNGESKYLVKKVMERYYPKELIYRKKWGFSIPLEQWLGESEALTAPHGLDGNYRTAMEELAERYARGGDHGYLYNRIYVLWGLGVFGGGQ